MKNPTDMLQVRPVVTSVTKPSTGRPRKAVLPDVPQFDGMSDNERAWFDWFRQSMNETHADLTDIDRMLVMFAGLELINYMRVMQSQLETGQVISMARQHPGVQFRALLDLLSVTRKQRGKESKVDPQIQKALDAFLSLSD